MSGMGTSSTSTRPARAPEAMQAAAKAGSGWRSSAGTVRMPSTWSTTSVRSPVSPATTMARRRVKGTPRAVAVTSSSSGTSRAVPIRTTSCTAEA